MNKDDIGEYHQEIPLERTREEKSENPIEEIDKELNEQQNLSLDNKSMATMILLMIKLKKISNKLDSRLNIAEGVEKAVQLVEQWAVDQTIVEVIDFNGMVQREDFMKVD